MSEMIERVARAMQRRAKEPLGTNIESLEPVLVGSLGDAWLCLASAAIQAMREPTEAMASATEYVEVSSVSDYLTNNAAKDAWRKMIDAALKEGGEK